MKRYEFFDHTADLAARVWGGSLRELFISGAYAMYSVLMEKSSNKPSLETRDVALAFEGECFEDLFKAWLDELLFLFTEKHLILKRVKTFDISEENLQAKILLEPVDREVHRIKSEIKAVTYHELEIQKRRGKWQARVIFDV